jgi:hypothetical protein
MVAQRRPPEPIGGLCFVPRYATALAISLAQAVGTFGVAKIRGATEIIERGRFVFLAAAAL